MSFFGMIVDGNLLGIFWNGLFGMLGDLRRTVDVSPTPPASWGVGDEDEGRRSGSTALTSSPTVPM